MNSRYNKKGQWLVPIVRGKNIRAVCYGDNKDFKIHYGEALVRLMQPKETGPTSPSPAKTQID